MKKGVLLVNLGSPHSPSPEDVKIYLHEFLLDKKVLDLPYLWRQILVRGIIIPRRYKESAKSYQKVWTKEGAPLIVYGSQLEKYLQSELKEVEVRVAMRYQQPSIKTALQHFQQSQVTEILLFPLFPQYAEATTGSIIDKVFTELKHLRYAPKIQLISQFATDDFFIDAFLERARQYDLGSYDHILFSFHGLPLRHLKKAAPLVCGKKGNLCCQTLCKSNQHCYAAQCFATASRLKEQLELKENQTTISFQSRLGKEPWLEPYTSRVIEELANQGKRRILVFCPSFVSDCLETIYEIGDEYSHLFRQRGGEVLDYVEGLNNHPVWQEGLRDKIESCLNPIPPVFAK